MEDHVQLSTAHATSRLSKALLKASKYCLTYQLVFILPFFRDEQNKLTVAFTREGKRVKMLGGHVDPGESTSFAAFREFSEESGYARSPDGTPLVTQQTFIHLENQLCYHDMGYKRLARVYYLPLDVPMDMEHLPRLHASRIAHPYDERGRDLPSRAADSHELEVEHLIPLSYPRMMFPSGKKQQWIPYVLAGLKAQLKAGQPMLAMLEGLSPLMGNFE
eukprot:gnl/Dysnectes_brevis/3830_a4935_553.p1 GENE.gnl/Dysnectes_brevis/3830_a4935_553~~gnl/Dysnectes_brevis/3830_a4935_553.p1  ORF type:complete len:219 (+),score=45.22 gnl/Dysnectes_brevis/3830_a4935_553:42-698(+)